MQQWHRKLLRQLFSPLSLEDLTINGWQLVDTEHTPGSVRCAFVKGDRNGELMLRLLDDGQQSVIQTNSFALSLGGDSNFLRDVMPLCAVLKANDKGMNDAGVLQFSFPAIKGGTILEEWVSFGKGLKQLKHTEAPCVPEKILIIGSTPTRCPHSALLVYELCVSLSRHGVGVDLVVDEVLFKELYHLDDLLPFVRLCSVSELENEYDFALALGYHADVIAAFHKAHEWHILDIHPNYDIEKIKDLSLYSPTILHIHNFYPAFFHHFVRTVEDAFYSTKVDVFYHLRSFPTPIMSLKEQHRSCTYGEGEIIAVGQNMRDFDTFLRAMVSIPESARIITFVREHTFSVEFPSWVTCSPTGEHAWQFIQSMANARVIVIPLQDDDKITSGITCLFWALAFQRPVVVADTASIRPFFALGYPIHLYTPGDSDDLSAVLKEVLSQNSVDIEGNHAFAESSSVDRLLLDLFAIHNGTY